MILSMATLPTTVAAWIEQAKTFHAQKMHILALNGGRLPFSSYLSKYSRCVSRNPRRKSWLSPPLTRIFKTGSYLDITFPVFVPCTSSLWQWKNPSLPCQVTHWKTNCQNDCLNWLWGHWKFYWSWSSITHKFPPKKVTSTHRCL